MSTKGPGRGGGLGLGSLSTKKYNFVLKITNRKWNFLKYKIFSGIYCGVSVKTFFFLSKHPFQVFLVKTNGTIGMSCFYPLCKKYHFLPPNPHSPLEPLLGQIQIAKAAT